MRSVSWLRLGASSCLWFVIGACDRERPERAPPAPLAAELLAAPATSVTISGSGKIRGTVMFRGPLSSQTMYTSEAGDLEAHVPIVDAVTRGLKGAVVWLEPAVGTVVPPPVSGALPRWMDQSQFTFVPHVLAVRSGQDVRFVNSDNANHNVHCLDSRQAFNTASTPGLEIVRRFTAPHDARPLELRCDLHPWMKAWIYVFDHPWFAVTDAQGKFELELIPVGEHTLRVEHADGTLARTEHVRVSAEAVVELSLHLGSEVVPSK